MWDFWPLSELRLEYECRFGAVVFWTDPYRRGTMWTGGALRWTGSGRHYYSGWRWPGPCPFSVCEDAEARVMPYLAEDHLDDWTYNKALQRSAVAAGSMGRPGVIPGMEAVAPPGSCQARTCRRELTNENALELEGE